jgi:hypothetical protein
LRCKSINVELASEPLAKFVTDANGKASGSLSILSMGGIKHILNDENATSADLHGRPLALIANDDGLEQCSLIKRVGGTSGKQTKVPSRRQQRKNKNTSKNPSSESDSGVSILPVDSDSNQSTESELTCTDIDCGKMKCAMFNSKDGDFISFEPRCVAPSQITCENVMCLAEMQCFQRYGEEATCIMAGLGGNGFA